MNFLAIFKKEKGFTVVELIFVVAVAFVFAAVSQAGFFSFQDRNNLEIATNNVVESLRHAKANAQQSQGDSKWGVALMQNEIVVFSGSSYSSRNSSLDQTITLPAGVGASGLSEVVFEKIIGETLNTGIIVLTSSTKTKNITINEKGTISY